MTDKTLPTLTAGTTVAGGDLFLSRQGSDTSDKKVTATQIKTFTTTTANQLSVIGAGTAYSLTATPAKVDLGTTDPVLVINAAGTYKIEASATIEYNGATFAAVRTATIKLRRTNNTAADLTGGTKAIKTRIVTTETSTMMVVTWCVHYTTANSNDSIEIFGSLDVVPSAGSLQVTEATIHAERLQQ